GLDPVRDWKAVGDEARLRRIFGNLVENALRYSPAGSAVTLGVEDEGGSLRGYVDDAGPGLPEGEDAGRLFALFAKGNERGGKAGLGLYFCKNTIGRWGGTVGAETRPGGGSRFWFRLPRPTLAKEPATRTEAPSNSAGEPHQVGEESCPVVQPAGPWRPL